MVALQMGLGRRIEHDPRSRLFPVSLAATATPRSVTWRHFGSISNQRNLGGCVGFTGLDWRNTNPNKKIGFQYHDADGVHYYNGATQNDQWSDNDRATDASWNDKPDEGSSGLGLAKYFQAQGIIDGSYRWAFTLDQFVIGLQEGPWAVGVQWTNDMFKPDSTTGQMKPTGGVAGGHELLIVKFELNSHSYMDSRVWWLNHWTDKWGVKGRAWTTLRDFDALRRDGGDLLMMKAAK
jgi:hypothetical protein